MNYKWGDFIFERLSFLKTNDDIHDSDLVLSCLVYYPLVIYE